MPTGRKQTAKDSRTRKTTLSAKDSLGRLLPLVVIEWLDTYCVPRWHSGEPEEEPLRCRSVGWLIHDGKKSKVIAASIADEGSNGFQRDTELTIPARAIVRLQKI